MNCLGGKSNTGEGGEDARRFGRCQWRLCRSYITGCLRSFLVTPHYLANVGELQIKISKAPNRAAANYRYKVSEYIGNLRHSVPGVTPTSPAAPRYRSIEDLAQLIYDLKNSNPEADVTVKLVSLAGVGTVAAGVAKGKVTASSSPVAAARAPAMSSIKHAGVPWELGLAETQQTLILNDLRGRIRVQTDGQLRTAVCRCCHHAGRRIPRNGRLVTAGCIMMRKCHLNTRPVGIATKRRTA